MIPVPADILTQIATNLSIDPAALQPLGGGREDSDGVTYTYPGPAGECVLKVLALTPPAADGLERLDERLKFANFLGQRGVDIVYPIDLPGGGLVSLLPTPTHTFAAYVMPRIPGSHPHPEAWSAQFIQSWGAAVGRLHRLTQDYPSWQHSTASDGRPILGWLEEWQGFADWCKDADVKQAWAALRVRLEALPQDRASFGFVHNDPHIQNLLFDGERVTLLDFDVANYHWFASDIAIACQAVLFARSGGLERPLSEPAALTGFLADFRTGYERENLLTPFWWEQVGLFIHYRRILLFVVMQGWLETVPDVRSAWKDMILNEPPLF